MKYFRDKEDTYILGTAEELRPVVNAIWKAWIADTTTIWPSHAVKPRLAPGRMYSLLLEPSDGHNGRDMHVMTADTFVRILAEPEADFQPADSFQEAC